VRIITIIVTTVITATIVVAAVVDIVIMAADTEVVTGITKTANSIKTKVKILSRDECI
jgi:hypothetical protein